MKDISTQRPTIRNQRTTLQTQQPTAGGTTTAKPSLGAAAAPMRPAARPMLGAMPRPMPTSTRPAPTNNAAWQRMGTEGPARAKTAAKMAVNHGFMPQRTTGGALPTRADAKTVKGA